MDLSLWDPPICEDESFEFGGNIAKNWLQSDFYYGYGLFDVIEEDALNKKACMELLKRKAKTDTEEVEEEITMLHRPERADEVWSRKYSTLKKRIHSLSVLILGLKSEEPHTEIALDFQNLGERVEKLEEMLKDLHESYSPNTGSQNLGLAPEKPTPTQSEEETDQNNFLPISCGTKIPEETDGPVCIAEETTDVKEEDKSIEDMLDAVHDTGEKAVKVELVQTTGSVGTEMQESNLSLKSGVPSPPEKEFPVGSLVTPEPSLAMEMEPFLKRLKRKFSSGQVGKNSGYKKNSKDMDVNNTASSDITLDPVSQPPGKKRKYQSAPVLKKNVEMVNQGIANMNENMTSKFIKEEVKNMCSTGLIELPTVRPLLNSLNLAQLRCIAKERKLKGFSKIKKCELIKALEDQEKKPDQPSS